jgi:triacylglycerol esterase/lipase EstA (alpha/beta hydrolase family)
MTSSLSPARRRFFVGLAGLVVVAVLGGALAAVRSGQHPSHKAVSQQTLGPVVLVPGYGGSTTGLDLLANAIRAGGRQTVVVSLPDGGTGDLTVQAHALATVERSELAATGAHSVDVVGYSAGGVEARVCVRAAGGAAVTRRLVTLGSPQHGTQLAALAGSLLPSACPQACQQLAVGSDLLAALNQGSETLRGPTYVSIYTTADQVVIPPQSAELKGALNIAVQSVCANSTVSHTNLPRDRLVQAMALAELASGPPVPLTSADCARLSS